MDTGEVWWVGEGKVEKEKDGGSCSAVIKARKAEGRWMMGAKGMACMLKCSHGIVALTIRPQESLLIKREHAFTQSRDTYKSVVVIRDFFVSGL